MKVKGFNSGQRKIGLLSSASHIKEEKVIQTIFRQPCLHLGEKTEKLGSSLRGEERGIPKGTPAR